MLIQTAERKHAREVHEQDPTAWWPRDAMDRWWRACKRSDESPERVALGQLDRWKYRLNYGYHLLIPAFHHHLQQTGAAGQALALDQISVAPRCAYSVSRKLRAAATGALTVRRSNDNALLDIGFSNNLTDTTAIATHCGIATGWLKKLIDQSAAAKDIGGGQANSEQPRIYNGTSVDAMPNGTKAGYWPTAASTYAMSIGANAFTLTGNPGLTIAIAYSITSGEDRLFEFGNGSGGSSLLVDAERDSTAGGREFFVSNRIGSRAFNYNGAAGSTHAMIIKIAASSQISTWTVEEGGSDLTEYALTSGTQTLNFSNANLILGNLISGTDSINGYIAAFMLWDQLLASSDLGYSRVEMANYA